MQVINTDEFPTTYDFILALKSGTTMGQVDEFCAILSGKVASNATFRGDCHTGLQQQVLQMATHPDEPLTWPFYSVTLASEVCCWGIIRGIVGSAYDLHAYKTTKKLNRHLNLFQESLDELRRSVGQYVRYMERDRLATMNDYDGRRFDAVELHAMYQSLTASDAPSRLVRRIRRLLLESENDVVPVLEDEVSPDDELDLINGPESAVVPGLSQLDNGTIVVNEVLIDSSNDPIPWGYVLQKTTVSISSKTVSMLQCVTTR